MNCAIIDSGWVVFEKLIKLETIPVHEASAASHQNADSRMHNKQKT